MSIRPLRDRILVKVIEQKLSDTIVIPDSVQFPILKGEVLEVGQGYKYLMKKAGSKKQLSKTISLTVKKGDTVMFQARSVDHKDQEEVLIQEADVLFIIDDIQVNQNAA